MEQVYKLVDQIYCINLISRDDRYANMKAFESEEKIKINYFRPEKDICGGDIGCFKSHIHVISHAYKSGHSQVLVFEDDIIKTPAYKTIDYNSIAKFIRENKSWEIIQFSWFELANSLLFPMASPKESKNLSQFGSVLASSYIINRNGMKKILSTYKEHLGVQPVDNYYCEIFKKTMWNVVPSPFDQNRELPNDNIWFNKTIDNVLILISSKSNMIYRLSQFKFWNGCYIILLLVLLVLFFFIFKYKNIISKIKKPIL
jgi:GR25 family glycosyltransferase involved in LPS biosynthesis